MSDSCDFLDCSLPDSFVHGVFQAGILKWVAVSLSGYLPDPGIEPASPVLEMISYIAGRFFTAEPPGKLSLIVKSCFKKKKIKKKYIHQIIVMHNKWMLQMHELMNV